MPDLHPTKAPRPELRAGCPRCAQPRLSVQEQSVHQRKKGQEKTTGLGLLQSEQMSVLLKGIRTSGHRSRWISLDNVFQTPCMAEPCPGAASRAARCLPLLALGPQALDDCPFHVWINSSHSFDCGCALRGPWPVHSPEARASLMKRHVGALAADLDSAGPSARPGISKSSPILNKPCCNVPRSSPRA